MTGFDSKRQAAKAKLDDDGDAQVDTAILTIVYQRGFSDGKKATERPWVGLAAEDLAQIESDEFWQVGNHMAIAMAVEAKLKEKNDH